MLLINFKWHEEYHKLSQSRSATCWTTIILQTYNAGPSSEWDLQATLIVRLQNNVKQLIWSPFPPFPCSSLLLLPARVHTASLLPALLPHSPQNLESCKGESKTKSEEGVSRKSRVAKTLSHWADLTINWWKCKCIWQESRAKGHYLFLYVLSLVAL